MSEQSSGFLTKYLDDAMEHISWGSVANSRCPGGRVVKAFVAREVQRSLEGDEQLTVTPLRLLRKLQLCIMFMKKFDHLHFSSHKYVCLCVSVRVLIQALFELSEDYEATYCSIEKLATGYHCNVVKNLLNGETVE